MTKLRLAVFAIMALSLIMGTSTVMVEAEKPRVVSEETSMDFCGQPLCSTDPSPMPICEEVGAVIVFDILLKKTDYGKDKFKLVKSLKGQVNDSEGVKIGTIDSTTTTQGFYEGNGAKVVKTTDKISCLGGVDDEFIHEVTITNKNK